MKRVKSLYRQDTPHQSGATPAPAISVRAFTIVEVMVAASVMVLAICSSIIVLQHGLRALDTARCTTLAGQVLQSQMEKLRLLNWTQFTHATYGPTNFTTFPADVATGATPAELKRFAVNGVTGVCAQSIVPDDSPRDTTMKKIILTAFWKGIDGRPHSLSYTSYYGKNGLSDFFYTSH